MIQRRYTPSLSKTVHGQGMVEYGLVGLVVGGALIAVVPMVIEKMPEWFAKGTDSELEGNKVVFDGTKESAGGLGNGAGFALKVFGGGAAPDTSGEYEEPEIAFADVDISFTEGRCINTGICEMHREGTARHTVESALRALAAQQQAAIDAEKRRQEEEERRRREEELLLLGEEIIKEEELDDILGEALDEAEAEIDLAEEELAKAEEAAEALQEALDSLTPEEITSDVQEALDKAKAAVELATAQSEKAKVNAAEVIAAVPVAQPVNSEINQLYQALLGRDADASGADYWGSQLQNGVPLSQIAAHLKGSAEYTALNPTAAVAAPVASAAPSTSSSPGKPTGTNTTTSSSSPSSNVYTPTVMQAISVASQIDFGNGAIDPNSVAFEVAYSMGQSSGYPPPDIVAAASAYSGLPAQYVPPSTTVYNSVKAINTGSFDAAVSSATALYSAVYPVSVSSSPSSSNKPTGTSSTSSSSSNKSTSSSSSYYGSSYL